ncbi:putative gnat family protein [Botrytis fragariae]|uniref:Putative gnat family protein n=1 Tax=Botrytis fragariae TaxID=1964551 RepID=A0A8H6B433_9HELO|nr:putative gnat family protein [Botrytis fragariae]KAF5879071.1 putative gnat family protein [Botrytis fragariae]
MSVKPRSVETLRESKDRRTPFTSPIGPSCWVPAKSVVPATRADIPRLAYIHVVACLLDNAFALHFDNTKEFEQIVTEMLEDQITAWASWNTPTDAEIRERDEKAEARISASTKDLAKGEFNFPPGLPMFVQAETNRWLERWSKGQRPILCKSVFTEPTFHGRGMGNALVVYGNNLVDQKGLPVFMQALPFGFLLYTKHGVETVQYLDVNLREWAPNAKGNDKGYGNYEFRYMQRLPQTLPKFI